MFSKRRTIYSMATLLTNNALQTFYHHQRQDHRHQKRQNQVQQHQQQHPHQNKSTKENIQDKVYWKRKRIPKTVIQSRKWKKTRNILKLILPTNPVMLTMLFLITVVISGNAVHAAQRDSSSKPKEANSLNAISSNSIATSVSSSGNSSNNSYRVNGTFSNLNENSVASSSSTATTIGNRNITSTTATVSSRSRSGSSIKAPSNVYRNTIEVNDENRNGPYFDKAASKNVTALLGKTAYLNCRVKNLGNKTMLLQVSWVRHRDIHLLTVGRYTYTSDQRFRAIHQPQTEDWILQIKYPQHRDSGVYECQVSTTPHMSHYIHLNVVEPATQIIGAPDLYIESGSTINLTCVILNSPEPPAYIFWNHNSAIINYDSPRGGVSVVTIKGETTTSFLLIKSARPSDSGQYQCNPSNSKSKGVTVHVLNGVSHSVSRGIPSSNAARGTSTSSNVSKSLSISLPINIFIYYSIYQTVSENSEHCRPHLTQATSNILKAIIFCATALLIKFLNLFQKYTHRTPMIIEYNSLQQYSNHDRLNNDSLVLKSLAYHHRNSIYHSQHKEHKLMYQINPICNNIDKTIIMQQLHVNDPSKSIAHYQISDSNLIITFRRKVYTKESDVR